MIYSLNSCQKELLLHILCVPHKMCSLHLTRAYLTISQIY